MSHLNYEDAWSFLDQLQFFKIKLGLDSMNQFLESLGNPHRTFPCMHIGGTNGKGSVGATLLSILKEAGYTVGLYTSPHLSSVRERFRIGDAYIGKEDFSREAEKIISILDGRQITYFEFTTALAMLWFADRQVDLAIMEVGLGGRLDATNVVTPLVSVITNVGMDHEQYLGNTLAEIAAEKAGIIKDNIPVVTGTANPIALEIIGAAAAVRNSPLFVLDRDFAGTRQPAGSGQWNYSGIRKSVRSTPTRLAGLPLNVKGDYQIDNAALALAALEVIGDRFPVSEAHIRNGLQHVRWPGRLEEFWLDRQRPVHYLLDGAHNPDGARALKISLQNDFRYDRLIMVWASMADKDVKTTLLEIAPLAAAFIFTRPEAERSARPDYLRRLLPESLQAVSCCAESVDQALAMAEEKCGPDDMICVAGSLYLIGRARQLLLGGLVEEA